MTFFILSYFYILKAMKKTHLWNRNYPYVGFGPIGSCSYLLSSLGLSTSAEGPMPSLNLLHLDVPFLVSGCLFNCPQQYPTILTLPVGSLIWKGNKHCLDRILSGCPMSFFSLKFEIRQHSLTQIDHAQWCLTEANLGNMLQELTSNTESPLTSTRPNRPSKWLK